VNIDFTTVNLEQFIRAGEELLNVDHAAAEKAKLGDLRGGNSGCITENGDIIGCHRASVARALGLDLPSDPTSQFYFDLGRGLEWALTTKLVRGFPGEVRCEEDAGAEWTLPSGRRVTLRPDFFLVERNPDGTDAPKVGVELKGIASPNKAHQVWFDGRPDPKHLCQAAHCSWKKETPWILMYFCPTKFDVNNDYRKKLNLPYRAAILPFRAQFPLALRNGTLWYRNPVEGEDVETLITTNGIQNFYELVDECLATKTLYLPPASIYADGKPQHYNHEKYCTFCQLADSTDSFDHWCDELHAMKGVTW